jgi:sulfur carrier protein
MDPVHPRKVFSVTLTVNGAPRELPPGTTLADLVADLVPSPQGAAAAVDGSVVPRRAWPETTLGDGAVIEIVTAVQGG